MTLSERQLDDLQRHSANWVRLSELSGENTGLRVVLGDYLPSLIVEFRRLRTKNAEWLRAALLLNDPYTEDEGQALLDSLAYENGPGG